MRIDIESNDRSVKEEEMGSEDLISVSFLRVRSVIRSNLYLGYLDKVKGKRNDLPNTCYGEITFRVR